MRDSPGELDGVAMVPVPISDWGQLVYKLDLSCPIDLPPRPRAENPWSYSCFGRQKQENEDISQYAHRRYLETLYLPDAISSMPTFVNDMRGIQDCTRDSSDARHTIIQLIQTLPHIERKHRKLLRPLVASCLKAESSKQAVQDIPDGLDGQEVRTMQCAVKLRADSRAWGEGHEVLETRRVSEEFERREILLQVLLLFLLRQCASGTDADTASKVVNPNGSIPVKWRKRKHLFKHQEKEKRRAARAREAGEATIDPATDPVAALEILVDRISIWNAISEDVATFNGTSDRNDEDPGIYSVLRRFWWNLIVPHFLQTDLAFCKTFHQKVYGQPIPVDQLPPAAQHRGGSGRRVGSPQKTERAQTVMPDPSASGRSSSLVRTFSRAASEATLRNSPPPIIEMRRSVSRTSETQTQPRGHKRDRSLSTDLSGRESLASLAAVSHTEQRQIRRAPSAKELFKGREVAIMSRSRSFAIRKEKEAAREESQKTGGLLGRKASDPAAKRRLSGGGESQSRTDAPSSMKAPALVMATPSKPKASSHAFGLTRSYAGLAHPTPIQEEPSSAERISWVAETPVNPHRISHQMPYGAAGTTLIEADGEDENEDSDDPLADLMVMTDDEDAGDVGVPETPAR